MIDEKGRIHDIHHAVTHTTYIFPSDTNLTVTLTAHVNANTWSAQTELVDSGATSFASVITDDPGHITGCLIENI